MPNPGCVQCANGEWQCGSDTTELCGAGAGWTPAGALCLQFFVKKHPVSGNCLIRVQPSFLEKCDGYEVVLPQPASISTPSKISTQSKKPTKKKRK